MFHQYTATGHNLSRATVALTEEQFYAVWTLQRFGWLPTNGTPAAKEFAKAHIGEFRPAATVAAFMQSNGIEVYHA
jgi:hypothetical protein